MMPMRQMLRRLAFSVFPLAALLLAEPLLHQHPLSQSTTNSNSICAVCAIGVSPLPSIAPSVAADRIIIYTLVPTTVTTIAVAVPLQLSSRAPPAL
jgi:hypothetical protein